MRLQEGPETCINNEVCVNGWGKEGTEQGYSVIGSWLRKGRQGYALYVHTHGGREEGKPENLVGVDHTCFPQLRFQSHPFYYKRNKCKQSRGFMRALWVWEQDTHARSWYHSKTVNHMVINWEVPAQTIRAVLDHRSWRQQRWVHRLRAWKSPWYWQKWKAPTETLNRKQMNDILGSFLSIILSIFENRIT